MSKTRLKRAAQWKPEPLYKRLEMCCLMLSIHGCLSEAEKDRIRQRIQDNYYDGRYHEVPAP